MRYFRCVAKALAKHGLKFAAKLAGVDAFYEFGVDVYNECREAHQEEALRLQLEEVAPLTAAEARIEAEQAIAAVAPQAPPEQQRALIDYLTLLPAQARQSLRRAEDPTGTTVPATQRFQSVEDLLPFLPARLPLFQAGERPLAGVDLELVEMLGRGGFGEVWKARNPFIQNAEPVVLKFTTDESAIKILRHEAGVLDRVMQRGQHPGIVRLHRTYLSAQYPCLEFEFVPGFDLSALIRRLHAKKQADWTAVHPWLVQLVDIVAFAHQANPPIVHCDLKPANIFVHRRADGKVRLRILDFGIGGLASYEAALETQQPQTSHSELMTKAARGAFTPLYASPQQKLRRRDQPPDPRDDIHALGIIWYQLLTGDLAMVAFPSNWSSRLGKLGVPAPLVELLGQCVSPDEPDRPRNATVLLEELKKHTSKAAKPAPPELGSNETDQKPQQKPLLRGKVGDTIANSLGMKFAWVPPGQSWLGGGDGTPGQTSFQLPAGLWCGVYPVTQAEWEAVMGDAPSQFKDNPRYPVESVSWDRVQEFLAKLNKKAPGDGLLYRLLTEQEWEYICRGGPISHQQSAYRYYFARSQSDLTPAPTNDLSKDQANFGNSLGHPSEVGLYLPNPLGICDLHGNVREWTSSSEAADRVFRGGGWRDRAGGCTAAGRNTIEPGSASRYLGFRLLAVPSS